MIIGLSGKKQSGKGEVAKILLNWRPGMFSKLSLAGPIKSAIADWFDLGDFDEDADDSLEDKESILPEWGVSKRDLWIRLGTGFGRSAHPDVWVRLLMRRIDKIKEPRIVPSIFKEGAFVVQQPSVFIVSDVRFDNEAEAIRAQGGVVWSITRPETQDTAVVDISEQGLSAHLIDAHISNDGDLSDLARSVIKTYHDCFNYAE